MTTTGVKTKTAGAIVRQRPPISASGHATGDYDNDGDVDLLIIAMDGPPVLLRNDVRTAGHWVKLQLRSCHGSHAINAWAEATCGGVTQVREVRSGST